MAELLWRLGIWIAAALLVAITWYVVAKALTPFPSKRGARPLYGNPKHKDRLDEFIRWHAIKGLCAILLGLIVPAALLYFTCVNSELAFGSSQVLNSATVGQPISESDITLFVADQTLKGALSDVLELLDRSVSPAKINRSETAFLVVIAIYRFLVSTMGLAGLYYISRITLAIIDRLCFGRYFFVWPYNFSRLARTPSETTDGESNTVSLIAGADTTTIG